MLLFTPFKDPVNDLLVLTTKLVILDHVDDWKKDTRPYFKVDNIGCMEEQVCEDCHGCSHVPLHVGILRKMDHVLK